MTLPFGLLIARQRSGTGALGTVLDRHRALHYLGEVFHPSNYGQTKNYFSYYKVALERDPELCLPDRVEERLKGFLDTIREPGVTPIVDVKTNSLHHLSPGWHGPTSEPWLISHARNNDAPIIHLTRRNLAEVFVSGRLAEANAVWHAKEASEVKVKSAEIDPTQMLRFIQHAELEDAFVARCLSGHSSLVTLDHSEAFDDEGNLKGEYAEEIANAFKVAPFTILSPAFVKQAPRDLRESIENFDVVSRALAGTGYEWMIGQERLPQRSTAAVRVEEANKKSIDHVSVFRSKNPPENFGKIDNAFHHFKNNYPYFGPISVEVDDTSVVMFSGNDDLIAMTYFWHGPSSFEQRSISLWRDHCKTAKTIFDVGAHSGLYSLLAAAVNPESKIRAFEPSRRIHGRLLLNKFMNGFQSRIHAEAMAVAAKKGELRLLQFRGENILGPGTSLMEKKDIPVTDSSEIVQTVALDDYCKDTGLWPDLIKIDVEGAELEVLKGAKNLFSKVRPVMLLEVTPQTAGDVRKVLDKHDYSVKIVNEMTASLMDFEGAVPGVCNLYCRPAGS